MPSKQSKRSKNSPAREVASPAGRKPHLAPTVLALALSAALALPGAAFAVDWEGSTDNDWTVDANWNPTGAPTAGLSANINNAAGQTVFVNGQSAAALNLFVGIGAGATGDLLIENTGTLTTNGSQLGAGIGATGTVTVSDAGTLWTNTSGISIGNTGNGTLAISGGAVVNNDLALIGEFGTATGTVTVDGMGSQFNNSGDLAVGQGGTGTLEITTGGLVSNQFGNVGVAANSNGTVTVDGAGGASKWTNNQGLTVGDGGTGQVTLLNGGTMGSTSGTLGNAANSSGTVTVDGTGSLWTNTGNLTVGVDGAGVMDIKNGGKVTNIAAFIGTGAPGAAGTGKVTVSGDNGAGVASTWTSTGALAVGVTGNGALDILAGGAVNSDSGDIGSQAGSVGTVKIDGPNSIWTNTLQLTVGNAGTGTVDITLGGELVTGNAIIGATGTGTVNVTGTGSKWTSNFGRITIGDAGTGIGTLNINNGVVSASQGFIGAQSGSKGTVTVDGAAGFWNNSSNIRVGDLGDGTLTMTNKSTVSSAGGSIGFGAGGTGQVTVNDSTWNITGGSDLLVGLDGNGTLDILNGGKVGNANAVLGNSAGTQGKVTIKDTGSTWDNTGKITVGGSGTGKLTISGDADVTSVGGDIASVGGSTGTVNVTGQGSTWNSNGSNLTVGNGGAGTMTVQNGGAVTVTGAQVVVGSGASSVSTLTVTGDGSTLGAAAGFSIGGAGTGTLTLSAGGRANGSSGTIGGTGSGAVLVDGADTNGLASKWQLNGNLIVANLGTGKLDISNGGWVNSGSANVGFDVGSDGKVTVAGASSQWTNTGALVIGDAGTGSLAISGGGLVSNANGTIGSQAGSTGTVTVDGATSTWTNNGNLHVGGAGKGSLTISNKAVVNAKTGGTVIESSIPVALSAAVPATLSILSGGKLNSSFSTIGSTGGTRGSVLVDGTGSNWTSTIAGLAIGLIVGDAGIGTLTITNGGSVNNFDAVIGNQGGSDGAVMVDGAGAGTGAGAGATWTSGNDLFVGVGGKGTLKITNGGVVSNNNGDIGSAFGAVGDVTVDGNGSSWTSSGIRVGNGGAGSLTIANGGTVTATGVIFIADKAGSTGALNIGGAATLAATAPGTLVAPFAVKFASGAGTINFNHTDTSGNYVFDADIRYASPLNDGNGTINQIAGWTNLTGDSSTFTGQTNITGGRLAVNGSLGGSQMNVSSTGILGGNGTVGNTFVNAGGIIAPGNSIGTLNVNGNVTFAVGSVYQVEANALSQSDNLKVSGTATINGGTVQVIAANGNYSPTTSYSILTVTGGVTGTFGSVSADLAFLDPALNYTANDVTLTLTRNGTPIGGVGQTPGQVSTGNGVQSLGNLGVDGTIYNAVLGLSVPQARNALQQLSGEVHASARSVILQDSHFARDASLERLRALDSESVSNDGGADPEAGKSSARLLPSVRDLAYWAKAMGSWGHIDGDAGTGSVKRDTSGFLMGADTRFGEEGRFGLMGGYSRSAFEVTDRASSGSSDSYHLGAYAGSRWGDLALRTGISYSWNDVSTSRVVAFPGFTDSLKGDYKASTTQAFVELGYRIKTERADLEPFANLAHVNVSSDGFTERGGLAALTSAGDSSGTTFSTVGLRASTKVAMSGGADVTARGMLGWRHASGNTAPTTTVAFTGGLPFVIAGVPVARNAAVVEAGLDFKLTNAATLGVSYGGQFGSGLQDHSARVNLNVAF